MFKQKTSDESEAIDTIADNVTHEMLEYGPDSEEYPKMLGYLERLTALKTSHRPKRISPDTLALIVGNLVGILIIVAYEQKHVMTSKSLGFILRPNS